MTPTHIENSVTGLLELMDMDSKVAISGAAWPMKNWVSAASDHPFDVEEMSCGYDNLS